MKFENNKIFAALEVITNFIQLNVIWLLLCLPIVTIFPATAAMVCVLRQWVLYKDTSIYRSFFKQFKENFKQSFLIGLMALLFSGVLYADFYFFNQLESLRTYLLPALLILLIIAVFMLIFLFPIMANYQMTIKEIIKNSLFFSLIYFPSSLLGMLILAIMVFVTKFWPTTLFFIPSAGFCLIYLICQRVFNKIERMKSRETAS